MTTPAARNLVPSLSSLGLNGRNAKSDLESLGWLQPDSVDVLWSLAGAADPDLALNTLMRIADSLEESARADFLLELRQNLVFRVRLFSLIGASAALGDHLVACKDQWRALQWGFPTRQEMMRGMLSAVAAQPAVFSSESKDTEGSSDDPDREFSFDTDFSEPDTAEESLETPGTYIAGISGPEAEKELKKAYRTFLLRIAASDLAGSYPKDSRRLGQPEVPFEVVTQALADLADAGLSAALAVAARNVYGEDLIDTHLAVIAMGKCGAQELNYISDVDVIFVAEPVTPRAQRLAGEFIRIGSSTFFEVDAALRPEGKHGALVRTLDSHVTYYKRWAHTWEFQALLKNRPMTGYIPLATRYSRMLSPMIWAASQRESFVTDVQSMRRRVLENVPEKLKNRELKLGPGGLRDVEFAVQLLQLVHGRSDESLRVLSTTQALEALIEGGYVGRDDGAELIQSYEFLRLLEHRLQLQKLKRTHTMPDPHKEKVLRWLARSSGFRSSYDADETQIMMQQLKKVRLQISSLHRKLFYRPLLNSVVNISVGALKLTPEAAKLQLAALGYKFPDRAFDHLHALAAKAGRKAKIQAMLLPTHMEWLAQTADPDAGLLNYRKLSDAANDRSWFLRMLRDEGIVGQRLMKILGNSPYTADLIISSPDLVKQLADGAGGPKLLDTTTDRLARSLVAASVRQENPEKAIAVARSLRRAELARIASADLLGMMDVKEVCQSLSSVWDAVLEAALCSEIAATMAEAENKMLPATIAVIGMGRLGGAELGYGSDADVLFVCDPAEGVDENEAVRWAITVCDRMRTRLAKPSGDPPLEVDLGLRPEGRSGAVVRTLDSYARYYAQWGEVWETQALLRAEWVAGDEELGKRFLTMIEGIRYPQAGASDKAIREVRRMKARVDEERLPRGADRNTHTKLGRGALTDIEWTVQLLTLMHAHQYQDLHTPSTLHALDALQKHSIISPEKVEILRTAWLIATQARNAIVLVKGKRADQLPQPGPQLAAIAGAAGWDPNDNQEFLDNYLKVTRRARAVVDEVFWGEISPGYN
ncbi:bifunctional [glutamine synthetase] adenylyltransferase/[glutamine synthetase]-adenylyl-L-tyrosine phosphorylase [Corynebacterium pseudotuberculosis]|uniref:Bifunctional glutamine synthetase adenylyltransferase/adenylyl-removing enzyme n=1 Tax=Corynebacterium pseudotuberculosis 258 TaxID=1168865 RepID=A0AAU8PNB7_CORPS|nr:bifunctional [glutamine synthetase] adenylyltransferase/[glutamine synthetase]-adenylyl-L-tyrosine phosphorylase [Corynebacterium pseudotuberculosis]AER69503.1 Glutamate-ammonia-ligase adenylyltransferase [Corynebacterium pseudotuberculosis 1/06-A]AEQ07018.1 bifunctional [glutamine synthetase] adenylyltransferase/[glutamine synthetase]-adenylyl-L-tyrosine phosphorylase [Corynebacterium pseudotuberculosis CIP 52.97]AFB72823.1 bifunctional [glutamine synthetase] adenylyltransferase/[glutamine s